MVRQASTLMDRMEGGAAEQEAGEEPRAASVEPEGVSQVSETTQVAGAAVGPEGESVTFPGAGGIQVQMLGMPAEATATIHVQTEGGVGVPPPAGLAEAISAMVQQAASSALGQAATQVSAR